MAKDFCFTGLLSVLLAWGGSGAAGDDLSAVRVLENAYPAKIKPILKQVCFECHCGDRTEADIDLAAFDTLDQIRQQPITWQKVAEMLDSDQMPPPDAKQPSDADRKTLHQWVHSFLKVEASAHAGDPGMVVLRRLNNAEFTFTIQDLTGVATLEPVREFPVDGAAGEGFTNTGQALVISPALVTKYLDAAKQISAHAVLLPDSIRFSEATSRSDWTNEWLARIRAFYSRYTDQGGASSVNLQGVVFDTNDGGRLPVERYLKALLSERDALTGGAKSVKTVATEQSLSPLYLERLWSVLQKSDVETSLLLKDVQSALKSAKPDDVAKVTAGIAQWQKALWRFSSVGHIGKLNGPKAWMEPVDPITTRQELQIAIPPMEGGEVTIYLVAGDGGDGNKDDLVVWDRPRLVTPGRPDLMLRDVRAVVHGLNERKGRILASVARSLDAAAEASAMATRPDVAALAASHGVEVDVLAAWLDYLGIAGDSPAKLGELITAKVENQSGYDFVKGWVGADALSVVANSSDQHVRIPGNMRPHSIAVHPAPNRSVAIGWRSPEAMTITVEGSLQHAHPECGNGVAWSLELRRGGARQRLATGIAHGATPVGTGALSDLKVQKGDVVALLVHPRDGNHSCDLTAVDLTIKGNEKDWIVARDLSGDILAGNPRADHLGNADVWHIFSESADNATHQAIPAGSLLAKWQTTPNADEKRQLAKELEALLQRDPKSLAKDAPDTALAQQLTSLAGPLLSAAIRTAISEPVKNLPENGMGLDPALFGRHPDQQDASTAVDAASLCVRAPSVLEVRLPAELVTGASLVVGGALHPSAGPDGSVQLQVTATRPASADGLRPTDVVETNAGGPWTSNNRGIEHQTPVLVAEGSAAQKRFRTAFNDFRDLFPPALCYTKIVPVDEVVTLTLFYREDDHLVRLMLDEEQARELDRLWDELHFISQDAPKLVDAYAQLMEYATQDADPKVFEPLRKPIHDRAEAFRQQQLAAESKHVEAVLAIADRAFRRPLTDSERVSLTALYQQLRAQEIPHEEAVRLMLIRVFTSPAFLYKIEKPAEGVDQGPVSPYELANRLSYFLWSSMPDPELRSAADDARLSDPEQLKPQAHRMLADPKIRRLATEFACQWLHIHNFDEFDEKSERHFPTFGDLRDDMYEEAIQFFTDLFQNDRSVLTILEDDHMMLNEELAKHYGVPGVEGPEFRRVKNAQTHSRGGILGFGAILAKQSGASRTSPILRGAWLSEVILGEKLPRPPKNVPVLSDTVPEGLTERQLTERHSSDPACAKCHERVDPFGFALENFDAVGRHRQQDAAGLAIDAKTELADGTPLEGWEGLKRYLLTTRKDAFIRQFNRKLLGYALGRSVQLSDEPLLDRMRSSLESNEYRFSAVLDEIILSRQFREIRGRELVKSE